MKTMRMLGGFLATGASAGRLMAEDLDMDIENVFRTGWSPYLILIVLMAAIGILLLLWSAVVRDRGGNHDEITDYPTEKDIRPRERDTLDSAVP